MAAATSGSARYCAVAALTTLANVESQHAQPMESNESSRDWGGCGLTAPLELAYETDHKRAIGASASASVAQKATA
jgi:hypothetical protein